MPAYLGWFGKTIHEPVPPTCEPVEEPPPVADCPVESIMDQIQDLSGDQLDMLLERIHAEYNVGHTLSSMVKAVVLGMNA